MAAMVATMPRPRTPGKATVRTTLDLPLVLWQRAKAQALREERDLRDVLLDAVRLYLTQKETGNA
jgi:hypothetical protein